MQKPGPIWHGAAIGWHDDVASYITPLESNYDRFCGVKLSTGSMTLILVSLYSPTHGKDDDFLECIDFLYEFLLTNLSENDYIVI